MSEHETALLYALVSALERCLDWVERDEAAHGRPFGCGNEAREVLKKVKDHQW